MPTITCPTCQEQFEANHPARKYCSGACKTKARDLKRAIELGRFCVVCSEPVAAAKWDAAVDDVRHNACTPQHGTPYRYRKGCRCTPCREAKNADMRRTGYARWISKRKRQAIYERDEWECQLCTLPLEPESEPGSYFYPTLDHIVPRAFGGSNGPSNLRAAHWICNTRRTAPTDPELWV